MADNVVHRKTPLRKSSARDLIHLGTTPYVTQSWDTSISCTSLFYNLFESFFPTERSDSIILFCNHILAALYMDLPNGFYSASSPDVIWESSWLLWRQHDHLSPCWRCCFWWFILCKCLGMELFVLSELAWWKMCFGLKSMVKMQTVCDCRCCSI